MQATFVNTPLALADLAVRLKGSPWIALDTEFIRERTYYPRLCLVQVATENLIACVDPLALDDLEPLLEVLYDPAITKVLHAAHQDLEMFYYLREAVPVPVFDTQVAATVLGQGEQVGYAALVRALLGVELDKSQTRTDWSRRPLDADQLAYAADDVRHLREVYRIQRTALEKQGRLGWLKDDFAELGDPERYRINPRAVWKRIKGSQRLRGVQLAVLRALAAWREEQAMTADRPRRWIAGDEALLEMARQMPKDVAQLGRIRSLESGLIRRHGQRLLDMIAAARSEPPERWPRLAERHRLSIAEEALVDVMMALVRLRGAEKGVSLQTLANRKDLERVLAGDPEVPLLHGWRANLAGREVQALLEGELRLEIRDRTLRAVPAED